MRNSITALAITALCGGMSPAFAQQVCGPYNDISSALTEVYAEQAVFQALVNENLVYELWFSEKTKSWTALIIRTDGVACVVSSGTDGIQIPYVGPSDPA